MAVFASARTAPKAKEPTAVKKLGDLMSPSRNPPSAGSAFDPGKPVDPRLVGTGRMMTGATAAGPRTGEVMKPFEDQVAENESFLSSPEVQAGLLQFAISVMQPGRGIGGALGEGLAASGRVRTISDKKTLADREAALAERGMKVSEGNLALSEQELDEKTKAAKLKEQGSSVRQRLFGGDQDMNSMAEVDLLNLAGELAATGDDDGAKIALDMANAKRLSSTSEDIIEYKQAKSEGFAGTFEQWQQQRIKAAVPQLPTAGMSPKMEEEAIRLGGVADVQEQNIMDMEILRNTVLNAETGKLTTITLPIRQAFAQFGITVGNDGDQIPLLETMKAQQNQLAMKLRNPASGGGLTGGTSDRDVTFLVESGPALSNTPEANKAVATIMLGKARMNARLTRMKENFILENGTTLGWAKAQKEFLADPNTTMFTEDEQAYLDRLTNPDKTPIGQKEAEPKNTPAATDAAPDGASALDKQLWNGYDQEMKDYVRQGIKK